MLMCDGMTASCATVEGLIAWICDDVKHPVDEVGVKMGTACNLFVDEEWIEPGSKRQSNEEITRAGRREPRKPNHYALSSRKNKD